VAKDTRDLQLQSSILLKVAGMQGNPRQFLEDILFKRYQKLISGDGRIIINTSTGGSSATWTLPDGFNDQEVAEIAYRALQMFDTQVNHQDPNNQGLIGSVGQVPNADRLVSYPDFSSIRR
jgi:hypothetical protein